MSKKAYLIIEDGTEFEGKSFGYEDDSIGEVVFNTSMSGYQEILTDPSYTGQIVSMTYPMIGNYGVNDEDKESDKIQVAGFIVKEYCKNFSNYRATMSLSEYLINSQIPAIEDIDTRKLTIHIRDKGALRGGIFFDKKDAVEKLKAFPKMEGLDLASGVSCSEPYQYGESNSEMIKIGVIDFGVKRNILNLLNKQGLATKVYPAKTKLSQIIKDGAKGIFISNGPGDPAAISYAKDLVKDICKEEIPTFGICLGHQLLSIGLGADTYKLKFGHRGGNQPVKNLKTGQIEITSQNHGFATDYNTLSKNSDVEITHLNLNDNTVEGLKHKRLPIFSVQYHPEASPGPHDSTYLFKEFSNLIRRA